MGGGGVGPVRGGVGMASEGVAMLLLLAVREWDGGRGGLVAELGAVLGGRDLAVGVFARMPSPSDSSCGGGGTDVGVLGGTGALGGGLCRSGGAGGSCKGFGGSTNGCCTPLFAMSLFTLPNTRADIEARRTGFIRCAAPGVAVFSEGTGGG